MNCGESFSEKFFVKIGCESLQKILHLLPKELMIKIMLLKVDPDTIDSSMMTLDELHQIDFVVLPALDNFFQLVEETNEMFILNLNHSYSKLVLSLNLKAKETYHCLTNGLDILSNMITKQVDFEKKTYNELMERTSHLKNEFRILADQLKPSLNKIIELLKKLNSLTSNYLFENRSSISETQIQLDKYCEIDDFEIHLQKYHTLLGKIDQLKKKVNE